MQLKSSLATQVALAAVNFAQNFVLIRFANPEDYGRFVLIAATALSISVFQNALILSQMSVVVPALSQDWARKRQTDVFFSANVVILCVGAVVALGVTATAGAPGFLDYVAAGGFVVASLQREFARSFYFVRFEGEKAFFLELVISLATVALSAAFWFILTPTQAILFGAALGTLLPSVIVRMDARLPFSRLALRRMRLIYVSHWRDARWALVGSANSEFQNRAYVYTIQFLIGLPALAAVQAGRLPFGIINTIFNGFGRAARPRYAQLIAQNAEGTAKSLLGKHILALVGMNLVFMAVLVVAWQPIDALIFKAKYPDVERYVIAWSALVIIFQVRSTIGLYLQAKRLFYTLMIASFVGSLACCMALALMILWKDPIWGVGSIIVAETAFLVYLCGVIYRMRDTGSGVEQGVHS